MSSRRFRPHQHIKNGADFNHAFRQGSRARSDTLVVVVVENGRPYSRLGLSVGKRIWKSAVRRNRVRRIFREAFRLSQEELPPGLDIVLVPARPGLEPELEATRRELVANCSRARRRLAEKRGPGAGAPEKPR